MHLYNAWLPPPVAEETKKEKESFSRVVSSLKDLYRPDDPDSVYSTLKWISVIDLYASIFLSLYSFSLLATCLFYFQFLILLDFGSIMTQKGQFFFFLYIFSGWKFG